MSRLSKFLNIAPMLWAIIIDNFGWGLVYPLTVALFQDPTGGLFSPETTVAARDLYLSGVFVLYPLGMLLGASSLGDLSDIYGRRKLLLVSTSGLGIAFALMALGVVASSVGLFLFGRFLSGLMSGTVPIAQAVVADVSAPEDKPFNFALLSLVFVVGLLLGPLLGSILADPALVSWFGYTTPLWFCAALSGVTVLWMGCQFSHHERLNPEKTFSITRPFMIFWEAFHNRQLRRLAGTLLLFQFGASLYVQTLLVSMDLHLHYTELGLGLFWVVMGGGFVLGLLGLRGLQQRGVLSYRWAVASLMVQAVVVIISSMVDREIVLWGLGFLFSAMNPFSYSLLMALFSDATPQESQGWVMGVWGAVAAVAFMMSGACNVLIVWTGLDRLILVGGLCVMGSALVLKAQLKR